MVSVDTIVASMQANNSSEWSSDPDLYTPVSQVRPLVGGLMQVDKAGSQTHHKLAAIAEQDGCRFYSPVIGKFCLHMFSLLAVSCFWYEHMLRTYVVNAYAVWFQMYCVPACLDSNAHGELGCCMHTRIRTWSKLTSKICPQCVCTQDACVSIACDTLKRPPSKVTLPCMHHSMHVAQA